MKNKIKSGLLFLGLGVFCAGVFAGGSSVGYRELFPNDKGVDWPLEETGWRVHVGNTALPLQSDAVRVSWVNGRPGNLEAVESFPANQETLRGFLFIHNLGRSQLIWTDEVDLEIPADRRMEFSWYQSTDGADAAQPAVCIDGTWYVSSRKFGDGRGFSKMTVRFSDGAWQKLDFAENRVLAPGAAAGLTGNRLEAVGFYVPNLTAKIRIDTVEVRLGELTPEMAAAEELLQGFVLPPVNFSPGDEYGPAVRNYQGIPGIESAPGGRLWATWYAGPVWEDRFNYMLVATSGDGGKQWTDVSFVIDPDGTGPKRVADPCLWLDPDGKLWLFFWLNGDGLTVTMAMTTDNPDDENPVWTEPRALFSGVMLNKPIVTSKGEWVMPSAIWGRDGSCRVMVSTDRGKTFSLRGTANIPPNRRNCDEEMIVERSDGSLWMLVRTANYGIGASVSTDDGKTWTEVSDYQKHATSRFVLLKLQSGNLLLVRNGPLDVRAGRDHMTAFLSDDDGATWKGGLLLDERGTSYPDATQAADGTIYAIYDQDRGGEKRILMAAFTEQDILAGEFRSPQARAKVLINRATGVNPSRGRIGADPKPRTDPAAELVAAGPRAVLTPVNGEIQGLPRAANFAFSDSDYVSKMAIGLNRVLPSVKNFVFSSINETEVVCASPGMAYVLTPSPDRNPDSVEAELLAQGFEKTSATELDVLLKTHEQARAENLCSVYQKKLNAGEKVKFGKWGVLVF